MRPLVSCLLQDACNHLKQVNGLLKTNFPGRSAMAAVTLTPTLSNCVIVEVKKPQRHGQPRLEIRSASLRTLQLVVDNVTCPM